jgi:hypothetical protein
MAAVRRKMKCSQPMRKMPTGCGGAPWASDGHRGAAPQRTTPARSRADGRRRGIKTRSCAPHSASCALGESPSSGDRDAPSLGLPLEPPGDPGMRGQRERSPAALRQPAGEAGPASSSCRPPVAVAMAALACDGANQVRAIRWWRTRGDAMCSGGSKLLAFVVTSKL